VQRREIIGNQWFSVEKALRAGLAATAKLESSRYIQVCPLVMPEIGSDSSLIEGMLVSNTYEKEVGKGKNKVKIPITAWLPRRFWLNLIRLLAQKLKEAPTRGTTFARKPPSFSLIRALPKITSLSDTLTFAPSEAFKMLYEPLVSLKARTETLGSGEVQ
jgi:hypothetical protein